MPVLLDVRDDAEFDRGHAPGAAQIPWHELTRRMHELPPKGAAIAIYHDDPRLGESAATLLRARGYMVRPAGPIPLTEHGRLRAQLWQPSPFLLECLGQMQASSFAPLHAADLGCGAGREAVTLAARGWSVDAFDRLPDALDKASDLARRTGVGLARTICGDVERLVPPRSYQLVCCFRFLPRTVLRSAANWLAPGGYLMVEAFHQRDAAGEDRCYHPGTLVADGELAALAADLQVVLARDAVEREGRHFSQLLARSANVQRKC